MMEYPILSILTFLPLVGALILLFIKDKKSDYTNKIIKFITLFFSVATLFVATKLIICFKKNTSSFQFEEKIRWFDNLNISYHLGVDGISVLLVLLTTILVPLCILVSFNSIKERVKEFMISFLVLETLIIGVFCALDFLLFYVFFEAMLIPMFLIIGIWGGENRVYASIKFFIYTLAGSVFLLIAMITIYTQANTLDIKELILAQNKFPLELQKYLWLAMFASFAVKIPMWPLHTWLPDAHVQAPTAGSVILAGILLKMGGYGFLRFSLPMLPEASLYFAPLIFALSIIAIIYASLVALVQEDIKKLIAYSSIAHMGYVTIGIFSFNLLGISGAMIQMISHGLVSAALFMSVGVLYDRMKTKQISDYGGVVHVMPKFALFFMIFSMASIGLPGTSGFVGESVILLGFFSVNKILTAIASLGVVLGAAYMLLLCKKLLLGECLNPKVQALRDLNFKEILYFMPLILLVLLIGIYPSIVTDIINISVENLITSSLMR